MQDASLGCGLAASPPQSLEEWSLLAVGSRRGNGGQRGQGQGAVGSSIGDVDNAGPKREAELGGEAANEKRSVCRVTNKRAAEAEHRVRRVHLRPRRGDEEGDVLKGKDRRQRPRPGSIPVAETAERTLCQLLRRVPDSPERKRRMEMRRVECGKGV